MLYGLLGFWTMSMTHVTWRRKQIQL